MRRTHFDDHDPMSAPLAFFLAMLGLVFMSAAIFSDLAPWR